MGGVFNPGGGGGGGGDVTAASNLTDNAVILGDGGAKGIKSVASLGTSGQVLTSNGAGSAPTFQDLVTGFADWKTIGTGGDYADVQAMIDDSQYRGVLISNVTEDSDITLDANGIRLHLNDYTLDMATNEAQITATAAHAISIDTWSPDGKISFAFSTAKSLFDPTATYDQDSELYLNNVHLECTSSVTATYINTSGYGKVRASNTTVTCANQVISGYNLGNNAIIEGTHVIGGGTTSRVGITINGAAQVRGTYISGTWSSFATQIDTNSADAIIDDITMATSGELVLAGSVSNIRELTGSTDITLAANKSALDGVYVTGDLDVAGFDFCTFDRFEFAALTSGVTSVQNQYNTGVFTGAVSFAGDGVQTDDVRFESTLSIASTVDEARFGDSNVYKGNVTVDGTKNSLKGFCDAGVTVTINSGAQYNDIDVTIDQAVTDNSGNATNSIAQIIY